MPDTTFSKQFGIRLAQIRNSKGMSQEELAHLCELHRTYMGRLELGKANPSLGVLKKLADALGVNVSFLFEGL